MTEAETSPSYKTMDRFFKVGDVIRQCPSIMLHDAVIKQGLGIVVEANGPLFKAYWTGDEQVRSHDARPIGGLYLLQDYAPIPQVAEWWKNQSK